MSRLISFWPIFVLNGLALIALWFWTERHGDHHWLATILAYIPQHLYGLPTLLLLLWALRDRNALAVVANLIVLSGFLLTFMGFNIPKSNPNSSQATPSQTNLRFVTYNLHQDDLNENHRAIAALKRLNPDIAVLQESRDENGLLNELRAAFPNFSIQHESELTTISRFPIRDSRIYRRPRNPRPLLEVTLDVNGQAVRVVNLHFPFADFRGPFSISNHSGFSRWDQTRLLLGLDQKTPLVIAGDFNTTPRGAMYSSLRAKYENAFEQAGWGFGFSYNSRLPVIRIDHVWLNSRVRATRAFTVGETASDHRPLVTDLRILKP
jgi:vancomycin resistance protein VanJ